MYCPACGDDLIEIEVSEIMLDVCKNSCGGIWFDNFELKKIMEKNPKGSEELFFPCDPSIEIDREKVRDCPRCDSFRLRNKLQIKRSNVYIDECYNCGGVFLDAGQFHALIAHTNNPEEKQKLQKEMQDDVERTLALEDRAKDRDLKRAIVNEMRYRGAYYYGLGGYR